MSGTINGIPIQRATAVLPPTGIGHVDVHVATGDAISGAAEVNLAGLVLRGQVDEGGPYGDQGWYRVVLGANRWNTAIPARPYRNQAGVKLRTIIEDAAREAGELADLAGVSATVGPAYARAKGPASDVLNAFAPRGWHVDELGVTRLGKRASVPIAVDHQVMWRRPDLRYYEIAALSLVGVVPGVQIDGLTVGEVRHELTPKTLRTHLWCEMPDLGESMGDGFRAIVNALTARHRFSAVYEYRVTSASETHVDVKPERKATGMPALANVPMWTGSPGAGGRPVDGSVVGVSFLDGDPTRPVATMFEGPRGGSHAPQTAHLDAIGVVDLGGDANPIFVPTPSRSFVRDGDTVSVGGMAVGPITITGPFWSKVKG